MSAIEQFDEADRAKAAAWLRKLADRVEKDHTMLQVFTAAIIDLPGDNAHAEICSFGDIAGACLTICTMAEFLDCCGDPECATTRLKTAIETVSEAYKSGPVFSHSPDQPEKLN